MVPEQLYGIIGHPLGHTLSPTLHNWAFGELGIPAVYLAWPLPPESLPDFLRAVRILPVRGASVTIPHKEKVLAGVDRLTDRARRIGAVNTLYWRDGQLWGENTDVTGFMAPLRALLHPLEPALVLGAGGACRAVLEGLKELGVRDILLANRTRERAEALAREVPGVRVLDWEERHDPQPSLVVNTTPLGMAGGLTGEGAGETPYEGARLQRGMTVYELIYNPLETRLIREAKAAGCRVVTGLDMFLGQGAEQFRLWTGLELDLAGARRVLLEALAAR